MSHRKPSTAGTLFLALLLAALVVPGVVVVAHDTLPHRLPWAQQHQQRD